MVGCEAHHVPLSHGQSRPTSVSIRLTRHAPPCAEQYPGINSSLLTQASQLAWTPPNGPTYPDTLPPLGEIPPMSRIFKRFGSLDELHKYVEDPAYSTDNDISLIYGAIVWNSAGPAFDYELHFNRSSTPDTRFPVFSFVPGLLSWQRELSQGVSLYDGVADIGQEGLLGAGAPGALSWQQLVARYTVRQNVTTAARFGAPSPTQGNSVIGKVWDAAIGSVTANIFNTEAAGLQRLSSYSTMRQAMAAVNETQGLGGALDAQLINLFKAEALQPTDVELAVFPVEAYTNNPFYANAGPTFGLFFIIFFALHVLFLTRGVVAEKETKLREGMRMMGLHKSALFTSWALSYIILEAVVSLAMTGIGALAVWPNSNFGAIFALFFFLGCSVISFSFLVSVFFSKSRLASVLAGVLFFAGYFPYTGLNADASTGTKAAAALLSPSAFMLGFSSNLMTLENAEVGVVDTTIDTLIENWSFSLSLLMLAVDTALYAILAWYLDEVWPTEFGVPRPFYFPFTADYWREACACCSTHSRVADSESREDHGDKDDHAITGSDLVEPADSELRGKAADGKVVKIRGLKKVFSTPDGDKVAVAGLDMTMYEGQIFVLLGHNGAGKTTTLSMLSGLLPPTEGDANIYGKSVRGELDAVRANMGVCPQHDVLWDDLTVKEHLYIFAGIKRIPEDKVEQAITDVIAEVGLTEKVDSYSSTLSGGQKRKLSVAIALIGDSKIVFLDEPTSGMDPYSRRSTWQILKNSRAGRIMVLTTHFMDEADILGDRIAIMADGKLRCLGSPMFLKKQFGVGYNLTLIKQDDKASSSNVKTLVKKHVSEAEMYSSAGREISMRLPLKQSAAFPELFDALDSKLDELRLETYGISVTTMEEVFLAVASGDHGKAEEQGGAAAATAPAGGAAATEATPLTQAASTRAATGLKLSDVRKKSRSIQQGAFCRHFSALFRKRVAYFLRDWKSIGLQMVIPILAVLVGLSIANTGATFNLPDLEMTLSAQYNRGSDGSALTQPIPYFAQKATGGAYEDLYVNPAADASITGVFTSSVAPSAGEFRQSSAVVNDQYGFFSSYVDSIGCFDGVNTTETCRQSLPEVSSLDPIMLNMSTTLLDIKDNFEASMYGAYVLGEPHWAASTGAANPPLAWGVMSNSSGTYASATYLNYLTEFFMRDADDASRLSYTFGVLRFTNRERENLERVTGLVAAIITVIGFTFVPASFVSFVVSEREVGAKHQQLISGVSIPAYWLSTWLWDYLTYLVPAVGTILVAVGYDIKNFIGDEDDRLPAFLLTFVVYGVMASSYAYMLNFLFKSSSRALTILIMLGFVDFILVLTEFLLGLFTDTCEAARALRYVFMLSPGFGLGNALLKLSNLSGLKVFEALCDGGDVAAATQDPYTALDMPAVGENLTMMACLGVLYFIIAVGIDTAQSYPSITVAVVSALRPFQSCLGACIAPEVPLTDKDVSDDQDVIAENRRCEKQVEQPTDDNDVILLSHMRKVYPGGKVAVRDMSFGLPVGQVFGFLGINGAGKTSTLKMLSGDVIPTGGKGTIAGYDIVSEQPDVRRLLGYCPQFDALLALMTTREHLELFARIKGVKEADVDAVVREKMQQMGIEQYEHKKAGTLSGGNKRKLSVAIALIGNPPVVLLDEPSTGMDPVARRQMWKIIEEVATRRKESSIILTTHSMEECEALCQKVGIMVGGKLRCMGSIQHIKDTHGAGYVLQAGMRSVTAEEVQATQERMQGTLTNLGVQQSILPDHVLALCKALGNGDMAREFSPTGSAWALHAAMSRPGSNVTPAEFAQWWTEETYVNNFTRYMTTEAFPGSARVERHGSKLRFQLPPQTEPLGRLFRRVESRKDEMGVSEYSLSQTTLEQVFNQFASQQEEEKGVARGMEAGAAAAGAGNAAAPGAAAPVVAPNPMMTPSKPKTEV